MNADFKALVESGTVWVLDAPPVEGYIVMYPQGDALFVENVAVDPEKHGFGFGGQLLEFAEDHAISLGLGTVQLYTNIHMTENRSFYPAIGYSEIGRKTEQGFERVYFAKILPRQAQASSS